MNNMRLLKLGLSSSVLTMSIFVAGCPKAGPGVTPAPGATAAPTSLTADQVDAAQEASLAVSDSADLETSSDQVSADLGAAGDLDTSAMSVQALRSNYGTQADIANLSFTGPFPAPYAATLSAAIASESWQPVDANTAADWMFTNPSAHTGLRFPRTVTIGSGTRTLSATESYYVRPSTTGRTGPFATSRQVSVGSQMVTELFGVEATGSIASLNVPAPFNAIPGVATDSARVRQHTTTFFTYGAPGNSAVGYRWAMFDASGSTFVPAAWASAVKELRNTASGSATVYHNTVAYDYKGLAAGLRPTEYASDELNASSSAHLHLYRSYDPATTTWHATGTWRAPNGATRTVTETWDTSTNVRTRTMTWTNVKGHTIVVTQNFGADRSGGGTVTVDGKAVSNLSWAANGQGNAALVNGQTKPIRVHR